MRLLRHKDEPESGVWRRATDAELAARKNRPLPRGSIRETAIVTEVGLGAADRDSSGNAVLDTPARSAKPNDPRVTVDRMTSRYLDWLRSDPDLMLTRVSHMRQTNPEAFRHLTDEQAADQILQLATKVATDSVERVYKTRGWDKSLEIHVDRLGQ